MSYDRDVIVNVLHNIVLSESFYMAQRFSNEAGS